MTERTVDYLSDFVVPIGVTNVGKLPIHAEEILLEFQSDSAKADARTTVQSHCDLTIDSLHMAYQKVKVTPNLIFRSYTNMFHTKVIYREASKEGWGERQESSVESGSWLLIKPAPNFYGQIFISYKEPEDRKLAELAQRLAERAGFRAYIAPAEIQTGSKLWEEKIPPALMASHSVFFLWRDHTGKSDGVAREMKLAREHKKTEVLLIEDGVAVPEHFSKTLREYTVFKAKNVEDIFAEVITGRRRIAEKIG